MEQDGISRIDVFLNVNNDDKISCQFKRYLSPITIGLIIRMLPLKGNAYKMNKSIVYFETKINSGIERKRTDFKRGDIAFLPTEGSICFYINDVIDGKQMTPLGTMNETDKLSKLKSSDVLSLSRN